MPIMVLAFGIGLWPFVTGAMCFILALFFALLFAALLTRNKIMDEEEELRLRGDKK
jgi:ABC-type nitrate/sulfonate/bicarbonate transport system permease component